CRRKSDNDAHRPRRIGLRPRDPRNGWQRGSARDQMQKLSAGEFHCSRLFGFNSYIRLPGFMKLPRPADHPAFAPEIFTIFAHLSVSSPMNLANSAGEVANG